MEVTYKKETNAAYMVLSEEEICEDYAARILKENRIDGVMPLSIREIDGKREYYFDISQGRSLSGVLERRPVSLGEIREILEALKEVDGHMEEYLMNMNHMVIEPGMIYLPVRKKDAGMGYERLEADFRRAVFCCHPACERDFLEGVRGLMQYFLNKLDHMEEQSVEKAYEMFQITQKEYFRLDELLEVCRSGKMMRELSAGEAPYDIGSAASTSADNQGQVLSAAEKEAGLGNRKSDPGMMSAAAGVRKADMVFVSRTGVAGVGSLMKAAGIAVIMAGCALILGNLWLRRVTGDSPGGLWTYSIWAGGLCMVAGTLILSAPRAGRGRRAKVRLKTQTG